MPEEESGGVRGLRAWAEEVTRRAARLFPGGQDAPSGRPDPSAYDGLITELAELERLLDRSDPLWHPVVTALGAVLVLRYLAGGGTPQDRERARGLLRQVHGAGAADVTQRRWAALFLLLLVVPLPEMGGGIGRAAPDFMTMWGWQAGRTPEEIAADCEETLRLAPEAAELPLPQGMLTAIERMRTAMSAFSGLYRRPGGPTAPPVLNQPLDLGPFFSSLPKGFPYADELRLVAGMLTGGGAGPLGGGAGPLGAGGGAGVAGAVSGAGAAGAVGEGPGRPDGAEDEPGAEDGERAAAPAETTAGSGRPGGAAAPEAPGAGEPGAPPGAPEGEHPAPEGAADPFEATADPFAATSEATSVRPTGSASTPGGTAPPGGTALPETSGAGEPSTQERERPAPDGTTAFSQAPSAPPAGPSTASADTAPTATPPAQHTDDPDPSRALAISGTPGASGSSASAPVGTSATPTTPTDPATPTTPPGSPGSGSPGSGSPATEPSPTVVLNAVLPALATAADVLRGSGPDGINKALGALRDTRRQMPGGHELTHVVEHCISALLQTGRGVGGNLQDQQVADEFLRRTGAHFLTPSGRPADASAPVSVPVRAMLLLSRVNEASAADDADALRAAVDELEELDAASAGHDFRFLVRLALAQACIALGALTGDAATGLRGVTHQERALTDGRAQLPLSEVWFDGLAQAGLTLRAAFSSDPAPLRTLPTPPRDASASEHWVAALSLAGRYDLTHDPEDLDRAVTELESVRGAVAEGQSLPFAADALWRLAETYRTRHTRTENAAGAASAVGAADDPAAATAVALEALHVLAADVLLQQGVEHGLLAARSGASRGVRAALWAAAHGHVAEAVTALELGRALVLQAASVSAAVPDLLRARGHHELADAWRESTTTPPGTAPGDFPGALPSTLRRQALEALGYRHRGAPTTPTVGELHAGVAASGADALVYLLPGTSTSSGLAVVIGPDPATGPEVLALPLLSASSSTPLEHYLDTAAERSQRLRRRDASAEQTEQTEQTEQAWEDALSALCDWAHPAAMGPVLEAVARPEGGPPRIVLVPCGLLGVVPWHAARRPGTDAAYAYACQSAVISYAASGGHFLRSVRRAPRPPGAAPVLVADPREDLVHAEREARALYEAYYPGAHLYGEFYEPPAAPRAEGTPDDLLGLLDGPLSLLHIASHGSAGTRPTVSALHLAFPDDTGELPPERGGPGGEPDLGMLTVTRLLDRPGPEPAPADGPLVVLSACETDLSTHDHDEALTLTTAFVASGARDVVGSRWTTQDSASALMMAVFHHYVAVEGHGPADALRAAQLWMLDPAREAPGTLAEELHHELRRPGLDRVPVWAAFIHQGHPGPTQQPRPTGHQGPTSQASPSSHGKETA